MKVSATRAPSGVQLLDGGGSNGHVQRSDEEPRAEAAAAVASGAAAAERPPCLSALTFQYFQPLMSLGRRRPLQKEDLPALHKDDLAAEVGRTFQQHLHSHRRVATALVASFWRPYVTAGLFKLPQDVCVFISPMLLQRIIALMEEEEPLLRDGLVAVLGIFLTGMLQTLCLQQYFHRVYRVTYQVMAALNTAIYAKSLVISNAARSRHPIGATVNLVSVDVEAVSSLFNYLQNLLCSSGPHTDARPHRAPCVAQVGRTSSLAALAAQVVVALPDRRLPRDALPPARRLHLCRHTRHGHLHARKPAGRPDLLHACMPAYAIATCMVASAE